MMKLLAERPLLGWPNVNVKLYSDMKQLNVVMCGDFTWETADRKDAKDVFFHPFAFGMTENDLTSAEKHEIMQS
jgi:hypothetical protein